MKSTQGRLAAGYPEARLQTGHWLSRGETVRYVHMNTSSHKHGPKTKDQQAQEQNQLNHVPQPVKRVKGNIVSAQEADDLTKWLQHNISPAEEVHESMLETHARYLWIMESDNETPNVADILKRYPQLLEPGMVRSWTLPQMD